MKIVKKSVFITVMVLLVSVFSNKLSAQNDSYFVDIEHENVRVSDHDIFGTASSADITPIGSGLLILTAAGIGYACLKNKKK